VETWKLQALKSSVCLVSADTVTLLAFADVHHAAGCQVAATVNRNLLPMGMGRSAANPPHAAAAVDKWDR